MNDLLFRTSHLFSATHYMKYNSVNVRSLLLLMWFRLTYIHAFFSYTRFRRYLNFFEQFTVPYIPLIFWVFARFCISFIFSYSYYIMKYNSINASFIIIAYVIFIIPKESLKRAIYRRRFGVDWKADYEWAIIWPNFNVNFSLLEKPIRSRWYFDRILTSILGWLESWLWMDDNLTEFQRQF